MHRRQAYTLAESTSAVDTPTCDSSPSDTWTLSHDWQLDSSAIRHVTPHREWFSTFSALRQDGVHGVGEIHLQFASGSMLVLHDVQYVPDAQRSLISISQLRDHGCQVHLIDESFMVQRGLLVIARGYRGARLTLLPVVGVRDAIVSVSPLPCICSRSRRVHFADEQRDTSLVVQTSSLERQLEQDSSMVAQLEQSSQVVVMDMGMDALPVTEQSDELVVHDTPMPDRQVERFCSSETRQEVVVQESMHGELEQECSSESQQMLSEFVQVEVERVCSLEAHVELTDMEFFDMLMRDDDEVYSDRDTAVHSAYVERFCSSESQQWESDCSGADSSVLQSFSDMLMPELDADSGQGDTLGMHVLCSGHDQTLQVSELACHDLQVRGELATSPEIPDCLERSSESQLTELVRLAEIARVASAFGALMYEMLISRPDIAAAVGAFAAGLIGRSVTDHGIQHRGVLQVLDRYLQECMSSCRQFAELGASSAGLPQHGCLPVEPDARAHRQSVGVG